jgi:hypothetical protein
MLEVLGFKIELRCKNFGIFCYFFKKLGHFPLIFHLGLVYYDIGITMAINGLKVMDPGDKKKRKGLSMILTWIYLFIDVALVYYDIGITMAINGLKGLFTGG